MSQMEHTKSNSKIDTLLNKTVFNKYLIKQKLGEGSFGKIYLGESSNEQYALKFECRHKGQNLLESEAKVMSYLVGPRIPVIKSYGYSGEYNILVMELLGKSLEDIMNTLPNKKMSVRTTCNLAYQMVTVLEYIHGKHIIHRDIKPDNFVMGTNMQSNLVYLLDFGLAKKYRSSRTLKHNTLTNRKKLTGTARYASIHALKGLEQSRRDDLEALGYVILYFLRGNLPWQGLPIRNKEDRYVKITEKKKETTPAELCKGFPSYFTDYVEYTRKLEYEDDPDYNYLKSLFISCQKDFGYEIEDIYDWSIKTTQTNNDNDKVKKINEVQTITVVNNYYHNTNNIVINPLNNDKDKEITNIVKTDKNQGNSYMNNMSHINNINSDSNLNNNFEVVEQLIQNPKLEETEVIDMKAEVRKDNCCVIW